MTPKNVLIIHRLALPHALENQIIQPSRLDQLVFSNRTPRAKLYGESLQALNAGDNFGTIRIEGGCWIGFGAAIVSSRNELVIGRGSVVEANSVVTRSVPAYSVAAGNPARIVKQYDPVSRHWEIGARGTTAGI